VEPATDHQQLTELTNQLSSRTAERTRVADDSVRQEEQRKREEGRKTENVRLIKKKSEETIQFNDKERDARRTMVLRLCETIGKSDTRRKEDDKATQKKSGREGKAEEKLREQTLIAQARKIPEGERKGTSSERKKRHAT